MKASLWEVAAVALVLALLLGAANVAFGGAADTNSTSESLTVDYANESTVSVDAFRYNETVTITNSTGTTLVADVDYRWNESDGTVRWFNTSNTSSGETVSIAYGYSKHSQSTKNVQSWLEPMGYLVGFVFLVVCVGVVLSWTGGDF